jgi:hypothetical protein
MPLNDAGVAAGTGKKVIASCPHSPCSALSAVTRVSMRERRSMIPFAMTLFEFRWGRAPPSSDCRCHANPGMIAGMCIVRPGGGVRFSLLALLRAPAHPAC